MKEVSYFQNKIHWIAKYNNDNYLFSNKYGPASVNYNYDDNKFKIYFILDSYHHNIKGPSVINVINNKINEVFYFFHGQRVNVKSFKEFKKHLKLQNIK